MREDSIGQVHEPNYLDYFEQVMYGLHGVSLQCVGGVMAIAMVRCESDERRCCLQRIVTL